MMCICYEAAASRLRAANLEWVDKPEGVRACCGKIFLHHQPLPAAGFPCAGDGGESSREQHCCCFRCLQGIELQRQPCLRYHCVVCTCRRHKACRAAVWQTCKLHLQCTVSTTLPSYSLRQLSAQALLPGWLQS